MIQILSKKLIYILLLSFACCDVEAKKSNVQKPDYNTVIKNKILGNVTIEDSAHVQSAQITALQIDGLSYINHSFISNANIKGDLLVEWSDIKNLKIVGNVKLTLKSNIDILDILGNLDMSDSVLDYVELNGTITSTKSTIRTLKAATNQIYLWNTNLDKANIIHSASDNTPMTIQCFGTSKIRDLTISSASNVQPVARIILDSMTSKTFKKSAVKASGQVEYIVK